ncbi:hypothetical protein Mapa_007873 [Marchantia paleacea]|nr:hypothetical protein Mapa_007873 [Marchantia paleacea]
MNLETMNLTIFKLSVFKLYLSRLLHFRNFANCKALTNNRFKAIPEVLRQKAGLNLTYDNDVQIINGKSSSSSGLSAGAIAGVVIGAAVATAAVLAIVLYMNRRRRKSNKDQLSKDGLPKSAHAFTLKEIKAITGNNKTLIGKGGFGPVYYGKLADGKEVAVKVRATDSKQGAGEFLNEVRLLSRLHHRNLVPLVGYCLQAQQQILVYVYMSEGSLYEHLYHSGSGSKTDEFPVRQPLNWNKRLDITINAARGGKRKYLITFCFLQRLTG